MKGDNWNNAIIAVNQLLDALKNDMNYVKALIFNDQIDNIYGPKKLGVNVAQTIVAVYFENIL